MGFTMCKRMGRVIWGCAYVIYVSYVFYVSYVSYVFYVVAGLPNFVDCARVL